MRITSELDDAQLISLYRDGDDAAADELYRRHHVAAWRFAVSIAGHSNADDIAAEGFARVLTALRRGNGPDSAFRAYLITTMRNTYVTNVTRDRRYVWVDDYSAVETRAPAGNELGLRNESSLLAQAFDSLPERWQTVLWHTTIERESHDDVGRMLGIAPSAVAALAHRAREGLRRAYLAVHLSDSVAASCRPVRSKLPAYSRGRLSPRSAYEVDAHVNGCTDCSAALAELRGITADLGAVLAPALLGPTAGGAYLGSVDTVPGTDGDEPRRRRLRRSTVGAAVVLVVGIGAAAAFAALRDEPSDRYASSPTTASPAVADEATDPPSASDVPAPPAPTTAPTPAAPRPSPVAGSRPGQSPTGTTPSVPSAGRPTPRTPALTRATPDARPVASRTSVDQTVFLDASNPSRDGDVYDLAVSSAQIAPVLTLSIRSTGQWRIAGAARSDCADAAGGSTPTTITCTFSGPFDGTVSLTLSGQSGGTSFTGVVSARDNDDPRPGDNVVAVTGAPG